MKRYRVMQSIRLQESRGACLRGACRFTQRVWLVTVIGLVATALLAVCAGPAQATKEEDTILDLLVCYRECQRDEAACAPSCCGRFFCGTHCLSNCAETRLACEHNCSDLFGGPTSSAFFDTVTLSPKAHAILASGLLQCPEGAEAEISVTLSQLSGAIAQGETRVVCPAEETSFTVRAVVVGKPSFQALSTATACAVAQIHSGARALRTLQWCRNVTVLPDGVGLEE